MLVADLSHFLDLPDGVPGPTRQLAKVLTTIVRAATAGEAGSAWTSALACGRRPGHRSCTACGDGGTISGWEQTRFDLRSQSGQPDPVNVVSMVVSAEVASTLRGVLLLDRAVERVVYRARTTDREIVLIAEERELEELVESVVAEANHEANRSRRLRLDDAFAVLKSALRG